MICIFTVKQQTTVAEVFVALVDKLASLTPEGIDKDGLLSTAHGYVSLCNNDLQQAKNFLMASKLFFSFCCGEPVIYKYILLLLYLS